MKLKMLPRSEDRVPRLHLGQWLAHLIIDMPALVLFLRWFSWAFGLTEARAEDEQKYAVFLVLILAAIAVISGVTIWFVLRFLA